MKPLQVLAGFLLGAVTAVVVIEMIPPSTPLVCPDYAVMVWTDDHPGWRCVAKNTWEQAAPAVLCGEDTDVVVDADGEHTRCVKKNAVEFLDANEVSLSINSTWCANSAGTMIQVKTGAECPEWARQEDTP